MVIILGVPMPISQVLQNVASKIVARKCILVGGFILVLNQERPDDQNLLPPSPMKKISSIFGPLIASICT